MKNFIGIALFSLLVLAGCKQTENGIGSLFEPIIGTWNASVIGIPTTLVFNADKTWTETTTVVGIGVTNNGTWDANDTIITRTYADASTDKLYYSFNSDCTEMTVSSSPNGVATTYTKD